MPTAFTTAACSNSSNTRTRSMPVTATAVRRYTLHPWSHLCRASKRALEARSRAIDERLAPSEQAQVSTTNIIRYTAHLEPNSRPLELSLELRDSRAPGSSPVPTAPPTFELREERRQLVRNDDNCPSTCYLQPCDNFVNTITTCSVLEAAPYNCDCTGCRCNIPSSLPTVSPLPSPL